jgi:magnesium transporter
MLRMFKKTAQARQILEDSQDFDAHNKDFAPFIRMVTFTEQGASVQELDPGELQELHLDKKAFHWIKVNGVHDPELVQQVADAFKLHPLMVEDILEPGQRPKIDLYEHHHFLVLRLLRFSDSHACIDAEQACLVIGPRVMISFQERQRNLWDDLAERSVRGLGRIQTYGREHMLYAVFDAVVDQYFATVSRLAEEIEAMEQRVITESKGGILMPIYRLKREVIFLSKSMWPLREIFGRLAREYKGSNEDEVRFFMGDIQHDALQVVEAVDSLREMLTDMLGVYMDRRDLRMNEIGQILTVVATIFIPLTFITGFYGMNFRNMPMIESQWGYFITLAVMLVLGGGLCWVFWRKGWFKPME